jgi:hypothetical protein
VAGEDRCFCDTGCETGEEVREERQHLRCFWAILWLTGDSEFFKMGERQIGSECRQMIFAILVCFRTETTEEEQGIHVSHMDLCPRTRNTL